MLLRPRLALLLACVAAAHAAFVARGSAQPSPTPNTRSAAAAFSATGATTPSASPLSGSPLSASPLSGSTPPASPLSASPLWSSPPASPQPASPPSASPSSLHAALATINPSPPAVPASKTDGDNTGVIVGVIMSVFAVAIAAYRIKKDDGCKCKCSEYEYGAALRYLCGLPAAGKGAPPSAAAASEGAVAPMLHNPMVTGSPRDPTA